VSILLGCGGEYPLGEFGPHGLEDEAVRLYAPPVILVHGIKGARLVRRDDPTDVVWGTTSSNVFFHTYDELALYPGDFKAPWDDEQYYAAVKPLDKILPQGVLEGFIVGWDWLPIFNFELYGHLVEFLEQEKVGFVKGERLFTFAYDWRLDNRVAAVRLADSLSKYQREYLKFQIGVALGLAKADGPRVEDAQLAQCLDEEGRANVKKPNRCSQHWKELQKTRALDADGNVRFTIVTHSMGALVARYFAEALDYKGRINKLVLFGGPNQGGMDAIRAILEGEHPPSFLHYLGIKFFSAAKTRKVHLSFGSLFQLFPRYEGAVRDLKNGDDITEQYGLRDAPITATTIKNWRAILAPLGSDLDEYKTSLDEYLAYQLESARCFHLTIEARSRDVAALLGPCREGRRITQIRQYLATYPDHASIAKPPPTGMPQDPPVINLSGYCEKTLTSMAVDGTSVVFLDREISADTEPLLLGFGAREIPIYLVGDNRVPVKSINFTRAKYPGDATFLICDDHVGIIKDESLQYNMLRAIFY
jgi:pimeloyl-ACP methyl ester carboxylesterase